jgi:hypothetical protein
MLIMFQDSGGRTIRTRPSRTGTPPPAATMPGRPRGAVDQDVDAAQPVLPGLDQLPHRGVVAGVHLEGGHGPARGGAQVGGRADAAAPAGHERTPPAQLQIHLSPPVLAPSAQSPRRAYPRPKWPS